MKQPEVLENCNYTNEIINQTFNAVDIFSGAGGLSIGAEKAGFNITIAIEKDLSAADTFLHNHPFAKILCEDICEINPLEHISPNPFIIFGGPPCQGFSQKGKRLSLDDERNYLFKYFLDVVEFVQPKAFVIENVPNILTTSDSYFLNLIKDDCEKMGYTINAQILDASDFGVPQQRKRAFIVGVKDNQVFDFSELERKTPPQLHEIFSDLPILSAGEGEEKYEYITDTQTEYQSYLRARSSNIRNHQATNHSPVVLQRLKMIPHEGGGKESLPKEHLTKSIYSGTWTRLRSDGIARTITTRFDTPSSGQFTLPKQDRCLTVREAARIQSFPDNFIFSGPKSNQMLQVGNAVPPLLAYSVAVQLKKYLEG